MASIYPDQLETAGRLRVGAGLYRGMDMLEFGIQLGATELRAEDTVSALTQTECYGSFKFSDTALVNYYAHGKCVREAEYEALRKVAEAHPTWSDDDLATELTRRGARYGRDARRHLPDRIPATSVIGEVVEAYVELSSVEFDFGDIHEDGTRPNPDARWIVTYAIPGLANARVVVSLEPFTGRVMSLLRLPPEN